jgi:hypothetical protein
LNQKKSASFSIKTTPRRVESRWLSTLLTLLQNPWQMSRLNLAPAFLFDLLTFAPPKTDLVAFVTLTRFVPHHFS